MSDESDGADLAWESIDSDVAYSCPGFDVVHERVVLPDGTESDYDHLDEPPAVVILPFTPDGDVVVIEEWRQAVGRVNRGLPAGSVEPDDADFERAARRELREETGYEADDLTALTALEPSNGVTNTVHHYFAAEGCTPTASQDLDFDEAIDVGTTAYDALYESVRDGDCRDARTALAVLYYETLGPASETARS